MRPASPSWRKDSTPGRCCPDPDPPHGSSVAFSHPRSMTLRLPPRSLPSRDLGLKARLAPHPDLPPQPDRHSRSLGTTEELQVTPKEGRKRLAVLRFSLRCSDADNQDRARKGETPARAGNTASPRAEMATGGRQMRPGTCQAEGTPPGGCARAGTPANPRLRTGHGPFHCLQISALPHRPWLTANP